MEVICVTDAKGSRDEHEDDPRLDAQERDDAARDLCKELGHDWDIIAFDSPCGLLECVRCGARDGWPPPSLPPEEIGRAAEAGREYARRLRERRK